MSTRPPIEGDGVRVNFFNLLLRTPGEVVPPLRIAIPDTIVFEHNCPRSWFYYDIENREIRKRAGRDLQAGTILAEFGTSTTPLSTVATFTYMRRDDEAADGAAPSVTTLYLTRDSLERLLISSSGVKNEGILQKYFLPLEANECVIQATWGAKLCLIRRRMNCRPITDRPRYLSEKHCTFDGPDHYSIEVATAKDTVADITQTVERTVEHVARTSRCRVVSIMAYFKLDSQRRPRLLWCSSLRYEGHRYEDPPSVLFICPELDGTSSTGPTATNDEDEMLMEAAAAQTKLERRRPHRASSREAVTSGLSSPQRSFATISSTIPTSMPPPSSPTGVAVSHQHLPLLPSDTQVDLERMCAQWYTVHDDTHEERDQVVEQHTAAMQIVDDLLYHAHTHFQQSETSDLTLRLPPELTHILGGKASAVTSLLKTIGVSQMPNGDLWFPNPKSIGGGSSPPTAVMREVARDWLDRHYARRLSTLMERTVTDLQWRALQQLCLQPTRATKADQNPPRASKGAIASR